MPALARTESEALDEEIAELERQNEEMEMKLKLAERASFRSAGEPVIPAKPAMPVSQPEVWHALLQPFQSLLGGFCIPCKLAGSAA